jgi:hypothetical protein
MISTDKTNNKADNGYSAQVFEKILISSHCSLYKVEIMALLIRNNKDITGFQIKIDEQTHGMKISGWHNTVFNSKNDISVATFSDLIVNRNKTEGLWITSSHCSLYKLECYCIKF